MIKRSLLSVILLLTSFVALAQDAVISKDANIMCDSDEVTFQPMHYYDAGMSGDNAVWNLQDFHTSNKEYKVYHQTDSLGRLISMDDRAVSYYALIDDTLLLTGKETPLCKITYSNPQLVVKYPLAYGDSISSPFNGYGVYCGDHPYREQGTSTVIAGAKGRIIINEDTIDNVLRVYTLRSYSICMNIDSAALDTARLKQVIEERYDWYARGYRYPLFTTISSTSYDNMQALGTTQKAYCLLPDVQKLLADPYNTDLRKNDSIAAASRKKAETDIIHYNVVQDGNQITIEYSLDDSADLTLLVSDAMGIVYRQSRTHNANGDNYSITIDCGGLHRGQYILHLNVNGKVYSNKVNLK